MRPRFAPLLALAVLAVLACSCGGDDDGRPADTGPTPPPPPPADTGPSDSGLDTGAAADAAPDSAPPDVGPPVDSGPGPADSGPADCPAEVLSTLDGVHIEIPEQPCTFTLARAAAGIDLVYDVVVDAAVPGVGYTVGCFGPGPSGLVTSELISGGDQSYCVCDVGLCMSRDETHDLAPGSYRTTFHWEGRNWFGPSDFGNPMGPPFPPGDYVFSISSSGVRGGVPFELQTRYPIHLVDDGSTTDCCAPLACGEGGRVCCYLRGIPPMPGSCDGWGCAAGPTCPAVP